MFYLFKVKAVNFQYIIQSTGSSNREERFTIMLNYVLCFMLQSVMLLIDCFTLGRYERWGGLAE